MPKPGITVEARRVAGAAPSTGDFTFTVLLESDERRLDRRQRTRLRSGKIVDRTGRFVTDCLLHDLSATGGRLRVAPAVVLPPAIQVYDDQTGLVRDAVVLWRKDGEAGVRFAPALDTPESRRVAAEMRRKFYAVKD